LPTGQTVPQVPQLLTSVVVSVQRPPAHSVRGAHVTHALAWQYCPAPHACPHEPQLLVSLVVSTHAGPHAVSGAVHVHVLLTHVWCSAHP
jgi:hypothetical protein